MCFDCDPLNEELERGRRFGGESLFFCSCGFALVREFWPQADRQAVGFSELWLARVLVKCYREILLPFFETSSLAVVTKRNNSYSLHESQVNLGNLTRSKLP